MLKFTGGDDKYVTGLPARNLSDADIESFSDEQRELLKAHLETPKPLYKKVKDDEDEDEHDKSDKVAEIEAAAAPPPSKKGAGTVDAKSDRR